MKPLLRSTAIAGALATIFTAALAQDPQSNQQVQDQDQQQVQEQVQEQVREQVQQQVQEQQEEQWIQLFNGKDLTGWKVKIAGYELGDNYGNTFRVEDSVMKVAYDQYESFGVKFGHIFHDVPYTNYMLRVEYRFTGEQCPGGESWAFRNSGIMIHGQKPETMQVEQSFPVSIEVQLLGGDGETDRSTANLCTPGTNVVIDGKLWTQHCLNSSSETYHGDEWVTVSIEVRDSEVIRHIIDTLTVMEYNEPQLDPDDENAQWLLEGGADLLLDRGTISLQSESHPIEFRKVELMELLD